MAFSLNSSFRVNQAGTALMAILFSLVRLVSTGFWAIYTTVMGGITFLLYEVIAVQNLHIFVEQQTDFSKKNYGVDRPHLCW